MVRVSCLFPVIPLNGYTLEPHAVRCGIARKAVGWTMRHDTIQFLVYLAFVLILIVAIVYGIVWLDESVNAGQFENWLRQMVERMFGV